MVLQVSVAVLLDNFVAASTRLEEEVKAERIKVILNTESERVRMNECVRVERGERGAGRGGVIERGGGG